MGTVWHRSCHIKQHSSKARNEANVVDPLGTRPASRSAASSSSTTGAGPAASASTAASSGSANPVAGRPATPAEQNRADAMAIDERVYAKCAQMAIFAAFADSEGEKQQRRERAWEERKRTLSSLAPIPEESSPAEEKDDPDSRSAKQPRTSKD